MRVVDEEAGHFSILIDFENSVLIWASDSQTIESV